MFVLEALVAHRQLKADPAAGVYLRKQHLAIGHLALEALQIIIGIVPLVWGITRLATLS